MSHNEIHDAFNYKRFCRSQTELYAAAWNAPSEPVSAFRAHVRLQDEDHVIRLPTPLFNSLQVKVAVLTT